MSRRWDGSFAIERKNLAKRKISTAVTLRQFVIFAGWLDGPPSQHLQKGSIFQGHPVSCNGDQLIYPKTNSTQNLTWTRPEPNPNLTPTWSCRCQLIKFLWNLVLMSHKIRWVGPICSNISANTKHNLPHFVCLEHKVLFMRVIREVTMWHKWRKWSPFDQLFRHTTGSSH